MTDTSSKRRTQSERRAESREAVLNSALRLFGEKGYADTSLEQIAADCGLTIRPIYHYFGNKKALFDAVNEVMEQRIIDVMRVGDDGEPGAGILENWRAYLALCDDPAFRRVVLIDSPNVLGRERWSHSPVSEKARAALGRRPRASKQAQYRSALLSAAIMGAFTEMALMIAEAEDMSMAQREAEKLIDTLFSSWHSEL
jgi:AcrR family transcriptional regulator